MHKIPNSVMDCIFCKIVSGGIPSKFLKETAHSVSFLDAYPLARGHVLVIPKQHRQKIQDMSVEENSDLFALVHAMASKVDAMTGSALIAVHNGRGAGQEIPHVHVHLVPRDGSVDTAGPIHSMFENSAPDISESELDKIYDKLKIQ